MKDLNLSKLYEESAAFKLYVDRYCNTYNTKPEKAFRDMIVRCYAEYIIKEEQGNVEVKHEVKQNCGC